jgi:sec-independent protein translocase protein TatA
MGSFSIWHWIVVGAIALLLFGGKGKISDLMGDIAKGIKSFKKGMSEDEDTAKVETPRIDQPVSPAAQATTAPTAAPTSTATSTPAAPVDHASEPRKAS